MIPRNKTFIAGLVFCVVCGFAAHSEIKKADLSGSWYNSSGLLLRGQINNYLRKADPPAFSGDIIALISPHAGIAYSGPTAAYGFKTVKGKDIKQVIVVGFSHRLAYDGIAAFDKEGIETPLGVVFTDRQLLQAITSQHKKIFTDSTPFNSENSIELILPFIQTSLPQAQVVLLAIGQQSWENCRILGDALFAVLKDSENYLIVASTDMSHYLPRFLAERTDKATGFLIEEMDAQALYNGCAGQNRMCGTAAVVATMIAARKLGANKAYVLHESTSARSRDPNEKVVGYLSAAFVKEKPEKPKEEEAMSSLLNREQKLKLLRLARDTIRFYLTEGKIPRRTNTDPALNEVMGLFVTLHKNGRLRGCIGNIVGRKPLYQGVIDMAIAASTEDPRFPRLTKEEIDDIDIEISVLSPLKKITNTDEIVMGTHGVMVKDFFRSGVYLPQVATETGWSKEQFMNSLCGQKAGMDPQAWKTGKCEIYIFTADVFGEKEFTEPLPEQ